MNLPTKHRVVIAGTSYVILSDESEMLVDQAVTLIDQKLKEVKTSTPQLDHEKTLSLVALQLAVEIYKKTEMYGALNAQVTALTERIEQTLIG